MSAILDIRPLRRSRLLASAASAAVLAAALLPAAAPAQETGGPEPTRLLVRAVAQDAKVIGSGVGGARITVREAATGEVLARGVQRGGTGDTERIVRDPAERGEPIYASGDAAGYTATLMLRRPTRVEVTAEGPLAAPPSSRSTASKTTWLFPGRHVEGQGLVLTLHGFFVEILSPEARAVPPGDVRVRARVRMACGCPTEPGGLWDSDRYEMVARLLRDGRPVGEAPLRYAGEPSTFEATLPAEEPGRYRVEVLVADTARANLGRATRAVRVTRP